MGSPVRTLARTVLLADDDPAVRFIARRMLEEAGYRVVEARDGVQAWTYFLRDPSAYDALLTDIVMPRMPGTALAARVHSVRPSLPILLLSAYAPTDLLARGLEAPHGEILSKPFGAEQLLAAVRRVCGEEPQDA